MRAPRLRVKRSPTLRRRRGVRAKTQYPDSLPSSLQAARHGRKLEEFVDEAHNIDEAFLEIDEGNLGNAVRAKHENRPNIVSYRQARDRAAASSVPVQKLGAVRAVSYRQARDRGDRLRAQAHVDRQAARAQAKADRSRSAVRDKQDKTSARLDVKAAKVAKNEKSSNPPENNPSLRQPRDRGKWKQGTFTPFGTRVINRLLGKKRIDEQRKNFPSLEERDANAIKLPFTVHYDNKHSDNVKGLNFKRKTVSGLKTNVPTHDQPTREAHAHAAIYLTSLVHQMTKTYNNPDTNEKAKKLIGQHRNAALTQVDHHVNRGKLKVDKTVKSNIISLKENTSMNENRFEEIRDRANKTRIAKQKQVQAKKDEHKKSQESLKKPLKEEPKMTQNYFDDYLEEGMIDNVKSAYKKADDGIKNMRRTSLGKKIATAEKKEGHVTNKIMKKQVVLDRVTAKIQRQKDILDKIKARSNKFKEKLNTIKE